jgi:hypothetical protein
MLRELPALLLRFITCRTRYSRRPNQLPYTTSSMARRLAMNTLISSVRLGVVQSPAM